MNPFPHPIDAAVAAQLALVKRQREVGKGLARRASFEQREAIFRADPEILKLRATADQAWAQVGGRP